MSQTFVLPNITDLIDNSPLSRREFDKTLNKFGLSFNVTSIVPLKLITVVNNY